MLESSEPVPEGTTIEIPDRYSVLARRGATVHVFEDMYPEIAGQVEGGMALDFISDDKTLRIRTVLDFAEERLQFDPVRGISFMPNREDKQYVRNEIAVLEF